ncbi:MAG: hypothetical protein OXF79_25975, partial [Chloroflexi bacterium]|nr:hypothetical protein [Chloroflexota bacterium]
KCNSRGRRRPGSCTPTPAATGRWCYCTTLSLPALATLSTEFLTESDLRHVTLVCNDPFLFGTLSSLSTHRH